MLYHLYEIQHAMLAPARLAADIGQQVLKHPLNFWANTPAGRTLGASLALFEQTTRRYGKPKFGFETVEIAGDSYPIEERIVLRKDFCQLKHFHRAGYAGKDPKLLIVAPLSGHYATLLRGTVAEMLPDHEVYITDWRDARNVPLWIGAFDFDDYVDYVVEFLNFLGPDTHVMAVCQPAVPVAAATALMSADRHPCRPATLTLMGGPIDTRVNPTAVNHFATSRSLDWFERNVIVTVPPPHMGFMRRVYPGFLQLAGFMAMNLDRHMDAHWEMFQHLVEGDEESAEAKQAFYDEYRAVMDLPAEYYLETIQKVFLEFHLPRGLLDVRGRRVDLGAVTDVPVFTVEGERDDISGVGQTRAIHDLCVNLPAELKRHHEQKGVGHYGIFNGGKWRRFIAPLIKDHIRSHPGRNQAV